MTSPAAFHVMTKPRGSICNLDCAYCYFLSKETLYPDSTFTMSDSLLEEYTRQYIQAQRTSEVTFAWQGGEPTLMGLDFYKRAVGYQQKYRRTGMRFQNALQTNGVLLDDDWCRFFKDNNFLIGISIDGSQPLHDAYRVDKGGTPTFERVMAGLECLKKYEVDFNILCTVNAANEDYPLEVYHFFRDDLEAEFIQFIPIVERQNITGFQEGNTVTARSVSSEGYGRFLSAVFDDWVRNDVGRVFIQIFDVALGQWANGQSSLCIFSETCGTALALEHNGDLYACDHFVEPGYLLGNIEEENMIALVSSDQQIAFGHAKQDRLPTYCQTCEVRFACNGGCPKNRFTETPDGESGLNYLCAGYRQFFNHIHPSMAFMVNELKHQRAPANVMLHMREQDRILAQAFDNSNRNDPCPCGSGRKYKQCHGMAA